MIDRRSDRELLGGSALPVTLSLAHGSICRVILGGRPACWFKVGVTPDDLLWRT